MGGGTWLPRRAGPGTGRERRARIVVRPGADRGGAARPVRRGPGPPLAGRPRPAEEAPRRAAVGPPQRQRGDLGLFRPAPPRVKSPCNRRRNATPSRHRHPRHPHKETRMKRAFALFAVFGLAAALAAGADDKKPDKKDNTPPEGFTALFNGKDLTGWHGAIRIDQRLKMDKDKLEAAQKATDEKVLPHWKVENGVLINDGKGGNLATVK